MMIIDHKHKVLTHLTAAIDDNDEFIKIDAGDYSSVLGSSGDLFLILRGPDDREIIKVKPAESLWGVYLKVERGQGGSQATEWPIGSRIFASTTASAYNSFIQKTESRLIGYNPNLVLTPQYAGEKVYQNAAGYIRWWKAFNGTDPYWDLITGTPGFGEAYTDIGWKYDLLIQTVSQAIVTSLTSDGWIRSLDFDWATCRNASAGTSFNAAQEWAVVSAYLQSSYSVFRGFYFFDLSALGMTTILSAELKVWRRTITAGTDIPMCLQGGFELPPLTLDHINSGAGALLSNDIPNMVGGSQDKTFAFNAAGLAFIETAIASVPGQILALVVREHDHDFLNVAPTSIETGNIYTAEISNDTLRPKITIIGS